MKKMFIVLMVIFLPKIANAQFVEDALRYSKPNGIITTRAASMGISYNGLVDDYGALFYNPAGLTLIKQSELSIGLGFTRNSAETNFMDVNEIFKSNNEFITNAGLVSGFMMRDKKVSVGIGYFRESDFYNTMKFGALNPNSSIIASESKFGPKIDNQNWAYELFLANKSGNTYSTPYKDSLVQNSLINERGGLHTLAGGIAFDVNPNVSLGASLIGKWGSYTYKRDYAELDILGVYKDVSVDGYNFNNLTLKEDLSQKVSGISGSIGLVAKYENFFRFGANIKFPTWYQFEETFTKRLDANYTNQSSRYFEYNGENSYNLTTPFVYSAGISLHNSGFTLSSGVEYTDVSQLTFSDANTNLLDLNNVIIQELIGQTTWGFGLEYDPGFLPFAGRISYTKSSSPYSFDIPKAYKSVFAIGASAYLSEKLRIDGVFRWTEYAELRTNYTDANNIPEYSRFILDNAPLTLSFGISYRY